MKNLWKCLSLALVLVLCLSGAALGEARLPADRGVVTDDADVLGAQMVSDIQAYAEEVADETNVKLHVAIVHFLDGLDAQTYADRLFASWGLGDNDLLLLGAAGEDSFATAMGEDVRKELGEKNAQNLLFTSSEFSTLFKSQQYDAAFGKYFIALNTMLNKQYNENIKLNKLFEQYQGTTQATTQPATQAQESSFGSQLWTEVMNAIQDNTADYQSYHVNRESRSNGMGAGGWIVLAIIILIIFSQSDPARKGRKNRHGSYRSYGCGCSPLGWIVSLFGINVLIDSLRRKH